MSTRVNTIERLEELGRSAGRPEVLELEVTLATQRKPEALRERRHACPVCRGRTNHSCRAVTEATLF